MRLVTAVIKPFSLDAVREALSALGAQGMTVTEVRGYAGLSGRSSFRRSAAVSFLPRLKIEVAVDAVLVDAVIAAIELKSRAGHADDGGVLVCPLERVVRIRTGEMDADAI